YDDGYALLSGFSPNQSSSATIHLVGSIDRSCMHEVELLLCWADGPHLARGYECNILFDGGYSQIVRWNGALGDFTVLGGGSFPGLKAGDVFSASIVGSRIAIAVNGNEIVSVNDTTYATGNPGIGFFRRECGANSDFGFSSFATSGSDGTPAPPTGPPTA